MADALASSTRAPPGLRGRPGREGGQPRRTWTIQACMDACHERQNPEKV